MRYCKKHTCWYDEAKCQKCVDKEPPYLRSKCEVANPKLWKLYVQKGWVK